MDFVLTPNEGYSVSEVTVSGKTSGTAISVSRGEGDFKDHYSFTMIDEDVTIRATIEKASNVTITVSQPVSYLYEFTLTGETSAVTVDADGANGAFSIGETVQVFARVNDFSKTIKAKLGDADVELAWDAVEGGYAGSFVAPSHAVTFAFVEGEAQEARTLTVTFNEVTGATVSYWEDLEDSDTRSDEAPTLYDHQSIYLKINEAAPSGKAYLVEMKADGDDEYIEVDAEEDHARAYYIAIEGNTIVRISYQ